MAFGGSGVSGIHVQRLAVVQIKEGVEFAIFPIRRTKETIVMLMNQVALNLGDVVKLLAQVIQNFYKLAGRYYKTDIYGLLCLKYMMFFF